MQNVLEGFYARTSRENSQNESGEGYNDGLCERLINVHVNEQDGLHPYGAAKFEVNTPNNARQHVLTNGHRGNSVNTSSNSSEHSSSRGTKPANRILDIERLKELPKLL